MLLFDLFCSPVVVPVTVHSRKDFTKIYVSRAASVSQTYGSIRERNLSLAT